MSLTNLEVCEASRAVDGALRAVEALNHHRVCHSARPRDLPRFVSHIDPTYILYDDMCVAVEEKKKSKKYKEETSHGWRLFFPYFGKTRAGLEAGV